MIFVHSNSSESYKSQVVGKIGSTEYQIPDRIDNLAASQAAYLAANQVANGAAIQAATQSATQAATQATTQSVTQAANLADNQEANLVTNATPNQVISQANQKKSKVKTMEYENHYDDSGDFIVK